MPLRIQKEAEGGVTLHRGPLLLALPIDAERRVVRGTPPFADYELFPRSEWRFSLAESELERATVAVSSPDDAIAEQPPSDNANSKINSAINRFMAYLFLNDSISLSQVF